MVQNKLLLCCLFSFLSAGGMVAQILSEAQRANLSRLKANLHTAPTLEGVQTEAFQLHAYSPLGHPLFFLALSEKAAQNSRVREIHDSLNLGVTGKNLRMGIWDQAHVTSTHTEVAGRVAYGDAFTGFNSHGSEVGGIMINSGVDSLATGIAPDGRLLSFDWSNDVAEIIDVILSDTIPVSNHSYGDAAGFFRSGSTLYWFGDEQIDSTEDYKFGFYDYRTHIIDQVLHTAPYYTLVKALGNNNLPIVDSQPIAHLVFDGIGFTPSLKIRQDNLGYGNIPTWACAKNILSVGAAAGREDGLLSRDSIGIEQHSSWGPTDDGRIKPDLVADGFNLKTIHFSLPTTYRFNKSATSYSAPVVAGIVGLIQEYAKDEYGSYLKSSTIRGLLCHTAFDLGNPGPDYKFGWGLVNAENAADVLQNQLGKHFLKEANLLNDSSFTMSVKAKGAEPLVVTIAWNDPAANPNPPSLNPTNLALVNDLDLRILDSNAMYYPYTLNPAQPSDTARKNSDNFRDVIEQVRVENPLAGATYQIRITHKGSLEGGIQPICVLVSGMEDEPKIDWVSNRMPTAILLEDVKADSCVKAFQDYHVDLRLDSLGDSVRIDITTSGSAERGKDYDVFPDQFSDWLINQDTLIPLTIRIYDDQIEEEQETISISAICSTFTQGVLQSPPLSFSLVGYDLDPLKNTSATLLNDDFESSTNNRWYEFKAFGDRKSGWTVDSLPGFTSKRLYISNDTGIGNYQIPTSNLQSFYISPEILPLLPQKPTEISFMVEAGGDGIHAYGQVLITQDGLNFDSLSPRLFSLSKQRLQYSIPYERVKNGFRIAFQWTNGASSTMGPSLAIDNLSIVQKRSPQLPISTIEEQTYLSAYGQSHVFTSRDSVAQQDTILGSMSNFSAFEYGCVTMSHIKGSKPFEFVQEKDSSKVRLGGQTFIAPTNDTGSGQLQISLLVNKDVLQQLSQRTGSFSIDSLPISIIWCNDSLSLISPENPLGDGAQIKLIPLDSLYPLTDSIYVVSFTQRDSLYGFYGISTLSDLEFLPNVQDTFLVCEHGFNSISATSTLDSIAFLWEYGVSTDTTYSYGTDTSFLFRYVKGNDSIRVSLMDEDVLGPPVPITLALPPDTFDLLEDTLLSCYPYPPIALPLLPNGYIYTENDSLVGDSIFTDFSSASTRKFFVYSDTSRCRLVDSLSWKARPVDSLIITQIGNTLRTDSSYLNYEWRRNGLLLPSSTYRIDSVISGSYTVFAFDSLGCVIGKTDTFVVITVEVHPYSEHSVIISPNPFTHQLLIRWDASVMATGLKVFSITGEPVFEKEISNGSNDYSISTFSWPSGFYFLSLQDQFGQFFRYPIVKE